MISVDCRTTLEDAGWRRQWLDLTDQAGPRAIHSGPAWVAAVCQGLKHEPYVLAAKRNGRLVGMLPLAFVKSVLFGRFLVSLPYVNSAGVIAEEESVAAARNRSRRAFGRLARRAVPRTAA